ncbi:MAG: transposase [Candidatus Protistobacter heckmanni]|nr:transposase [Candidatus Protistobacter heckmanni]
MARLPRLLVPGYPAHLVARGNNRQAVFLGDQDRGHYLEWLRDAAHRRRPLARHTQYFNRVHDRSGTLWEGRFKSGLIEPGPWLLACSRLIELKPVRAGLVQNPADYAWSSYRHHAGLHAEPWLTDHPLYWALGNTPFERHSAYVALAADGGSESEHKLLTEAALKGWALDGDDFHQELGKLTSRRAKPLPKGRPRSAKAALRPLLPRPARRRTLHSLQIPRKVSAGFRFSACCTSSFHYVPI